VFEFRLRILDVRERDTDPSSFLGIVEGFPQVMAHAASATHAERDLMASLADYLTRIQDREATRLELDDFPTIRVVRLCLGSLPTLDGEKPTDCG
jgi:hypothetical protein